MLYEMRRKDRQLDNTEAERLLTTGEYGILSTTDTDGCPYGVSIIYCSRKNGNFTRKILYQI